MNLKSQIPVYLCIIFFATTEALAEGSDVARKHHCWTGLTNDYLRTKGCPESDRERVVRPDPGLVFVANTISVTHEQTPNDAENARCDFEPKEVDTDSIKIIANIDSPPRAGQQSRITCKLTGKQKPSP